MMKCVPKMAPEGNRSPGGNDVPVISEERSVIVKSVSGNGEKTSNSRLTSVNFVTDVIRLNEAVTTVDNLRYSCCKGRYHSESCQLGGLNMACGRTNRTR